jgi:hypothetical protein
LAPDDCIFRDALRRRGVPVRTAIWNDPAVDWSATPVTVIRAAWDYPQRVAAFEGWLERVEGRTTLMNGVPTVRWNMHKRYLAKLHRDGVDIAPTEFLHAGPSVDLVALCQDRGWRDVVIKPCIAGGSYGAKRFSFDDIARAGTLHARALTQRGDAMVQPFLHEVETLGERAYIFIGGVFTHAVRKVAFNSATVTTAEERIAPVDAELAFARAVLHRVAPPPVYARVDVVPVGGRPHLMELELIEPTLYFGLEPVAAEKFAGIVCSHVN